MDALAKLQTEILVKPATGRKVICACLGDEQHEIGLRCTANIFESEGWRVLYLGARIPVDAIVSTVLEARPDVVCLSITHMDSADRIVKGLAAIADAAKSTGAAMVTGGSGAAQVLSAAAVEGIVLRSSAEVVEYIETFDDLPSTGTSGA
jgi:methanogenic corrinoid protein MtbC1